MRYLATRGRARALKSPLHSVEEARSTSAFERENYLSCLLKVNGIGPRADNDERNSRKTHRAASPCHRQRRHRWRRRRPATVQTQARHDEAGRGRKKHQSRRRKNAGPRQRSLRARPRRQPDHRARCHRSWPQHSPILSARCGMRAAASSITGAVSKAGSMPFWTCTTVPRPPKQTPAKRAPEPLTNRRATA